MEIMQCEKNGVQGWKCGEAGVCHIGIEGKQRAMREQKLLKAKEFEKNPAPLPKKSKEAQKAPKAVKGKIDAKKLKNATPKMSN